MANNTLNVNSPLNLLSVVGVKVDVTDSSFSGSGAYFGIVIVL